MTECIRQDSKTQLAFPYYTKKKLTADFDGGQITSDAGLLLLREFDERVGLTEQVAQCIEEKRTEYLIGHPLLEIVRQRAYQIAAGYEDANDANLLRGDPTFKLIADRSTGPEDDLSSQPTITRLENSATGADIGRLSDCLLKNYIKTRKVAPKEIILDIDPTEDPTHGQQELGFFNGYYDKHMYFPLLIFDGKGHLLAARLRPGNVHAAEGGLRLLARVVRKLREAFPGVRILVRLDSSFAKPEIYRYCEKEGLEYLIGMKPNAILKSESEKLLHRAVASYEKSHRKQRTFTSFRYKAGTWHKQRRIVAKAEVSAEGVNRRFVVTNLKGRSGELYDLYAARGEAENRIKELKLGMYADRLSCHSFTANRFRLYLHAFAYELIVLFREALTGTELAGAQVDTLRVRLFKVGARVVETARRVWLHLSSGWPFRELFKRVCGAVAAFG